MLLKQFHQLGLSINEDVAVDARLVKWAIHPVSNERLEKIKEYANTLEGKLGKNCHIKKF